MFTDPEFLKTLLSDGEISLQLERTCEADPAREWLPAYYFTVRNESGKILGRCDLRIGHNEKVYYGGNIGYRIEAPYRGHRYAAKACRLLFRLARLEGMDFLYISCSPGNTASARTCELAGGIAEAVKKLPEDSDLRAKGEERVCIYRFSLKD